MLWFMGLIRLPGCGFTPLSPVFQAVVGCFALSYFWLFNGGDRAFGCLQSWLPEDGVEAK